MYSIHKRAVAGECNRYCHSLADRDAYRKVYVCIQFASHIPAALAVGLGAHIVAFAG